MNTLHWHLSDDQGWRIEIKKWPRLTQIGAWRDRTVIGRNMGLYDRTMYGGFYTQKDIREIVAYAAERHITIIPEIDMPGHMVAALTAYPELGCTGGPYEVWPDWGVSDDILCAGNPKVYQFLEDVFTEVMQLFPSTIIHLGGDEAPKGRWQKCPKCQQKMREEHLQDIEHLQGYMVRHMEKLFAEHGRRLMGWDEIMYCNVPKTSIIMNWRDWKGVDDPAQQGYDVVRTPNSTLYFDFYQIPSSEWTNTTLIGGYSPLDKVYNYEPAPDSLSAEAKAHVIGVQANLWTEYIGSQDLIEYQVLPRMAALAEVQWLAPERKNYDDFMNRLPRLLSIYQQEGWHYCTAALKKK
jgi:hexosaminidase